MSKSQRILSVRSVRIAGKLYALRGFLLPATGLLLGWLSVGTRQSTLRTLLHIVLQSNALQAQLGVGLLGILALLFIQILLLMAAWALLLLISIREVRGFLASPTNKQALMNYIKPFLQRSASSSKPSRKTTPAASDGSQPDQSAPVAKSQVPMTRPQAPKMLENPFDGELLRIASQPLKYENNLQTRTTLLAEDRFLAADRSQKHSAEAPVTQQNMQHEKEDILRTKTEPRLQAMQPAKVKESREKAQHNTERSISTSQSYNSATPVSQNNNADGLDPYGVQGDPLQAFMKSRMLEMDLQQAPPRPAQRPAAQQAPSQPAQRPAAQRAPSQPAQRPATQRAPSQPAQRPAAQRAPSQPAQRPAAQRPAQPTKPPVKPPTKQGEKPAKAQEQASFVYGNPFEGPLPDVFQHDEELKRAIWEQLQPLQNMPEKGKADI